MADAATTTTTDKNTTAAATTTAATSTATTTAAATTASTATTAATTTTAAPAWPDDWRQKLAANDDKSLTRLQRFTTPADIWTSYRALEQRLSSGELKSAKPKDATPEQTAAWRKENGIPEAPEKYELALKDGLVIGKDDKPIIDAFLKQAHSADFTPAQASATVEWYYEEVERQSQAREQADKAAATKAVDTLRVEWGGEYRTNMNLIEGMVQMLPESVRESFKFGRLADGTPLFANSDALKGLALLARQINPVAAVVPNAGTNAASAIDDEIKQIEGWMKAPRTHPDYAKYWGDEKKQERYRQLLTAREQVQKKAA